MPANELKRLSVAGLAALAGALSAPTVASAATVEQTLTAEPAVDAVFYSAEPGERNRVKVTIGRLETTGPNRGARAIAISDRGAKRLVIKESGFNTCKKTSALRVVCTNVDLGFVDVSAGDENDLIRFSPRDDASDEPSPGTIIGEDPANYGSSRPRVAMIIEAGPGDDAIVGSGGLSGDRVIPGPGRDRVDARGDNDLIDMPPDGVRDTVRGGGGIDDLKLSGASRRLTVDLQSGTVRAGKEKDLISGIEMVHGGPANDTLLGSSRADALYGLGGNDTIYGRGGNDLLSGDVSFAANAAPMGNRLRGGEGDDLIDARPAAPIGAPARAPTAASSVACGPGDDRYAGGVDAKVSASCEAAAFRISPDALGFFPRSPLFDVREPIAPVARGLDGSPTYSVSCPSVGQLDGPGGVCTGTVALERPPVPGSTAPVEQLGKGTFALDRGRPPGLPSRSIPQVGARSRQARRSPCT